MKCPVCRCDIPPLQEWCENCHMYWSESQPNCPAFNEISKCELKFRHPGKHKATGVRIGPIELTALWHYPDNAPDLMRSEDYRQRHSRRTK